MESRPRIVMLGTAPASRSGIAALVQAYAAHGLFQRWSAVYLQTHREGSRLYKAAVAAGAWLDLLAQLALGRVALLHIHLASYASFWRKALFMLPGRLFGVPYILHLHGGAFVDFHRSQSPLARRFIRRRLRDAARVIALSNEWRDAILAIEPRARVEVIPNPVEIPAWQASLEGSPPTVLFLGNVVERKGIDDLLHAWPAVRAAIPGARLVVAGAGDLERTRTLARTLDVDGSVVFAGWVEGEAKDRLMRDAWCLALPSHVEALPMAVLEAFAAGLPVVATRVGGIPSILEDGRHGFLVQPRDVAGIAHALSRVLVDATARKAMGRAARERALAEFSSELIVPRIEALWREIAPQLEAPAGIAA